MVAEPTHAAVVLAAGGSRRLGRPKQMLCRDGETLLHRAARLAAASGPCRLLIVVGSDAAAMRAALGDIDAELLPNPDWSSGLASSLGVAARALIEHRAATLIIGCDQPALATRHIQQLLCAATSAVSGCAATLHQDQPGIPAVVSAALLTNATGLRGDRGLGGVLRALPAGTVGLLKAAELCRDIDDADDLEAAIMLGLIDRKD